MSSSGPDFTPEGWVRSVPIDVPGPGAVLLYASGEARVRHRCDRGDRGVVVIAPKLRLGAGHEITSDDPLTITPSILCPDCGLHGFVRSGTWVPA